MDKAVLKFVQIDSKDEITKSDFSSLENSLRGEFLEIMKEEKVLKDEKDRQIAALKGTLDSLGSDPVIFDALTKEVKALFPELDEIGYSKIQKTNFDTTLNQVPTFMIKWGKTKRARDKKKSEERIENYIRVRANLDTVLLVKF